MTNPPDTERDALKSCPMCNGKAKTIRGETSLETWKNKFFWRVFCKNCQLRQLFYKTEKDAIAAWNTRVPSPLQVELAFARIKELEIICKMP